MTKMTGWKNSAVVLAMSFVATFSTLADDSQYCLIQSGVSSPDGPVRGAPGPIGTVTYCSEGSPAVDKNGDPKGDQKKWLSGGCSPYWSKEGNLRGNIAESLIVVKQLVAQRKCKMPIESFAPYCNVTQIKDDTGSWHFSIYLAPESEYRPKVVIQPAGNMWPPGVTMHSVALAYKRAELKSQFDALIAAGYCKAGGYPTFAYDLVSKPSKGVLPIFYPRDRDAKQSEADPDYAQTAADARVNTRSGNKPNSGHIIDQGRGAPPTSTQGSRKPDSVKSH